MSARRRRKRAGRDDGARSANARAGDPDAPPESFADAFADATPLPDRDARTPVAPQRSARAGAGPPLRFEQPDPGEPGLGVAAGIQTSQLRRLRAGRIRPERVVDLHALRARPARAALLAELRAAMLADERCVLVVHGKGRRSKDGPVLRPALPEWLADPSLAGQVLAFAPAAPEDGGSGASYVLLRRRRSG